MDLSMAQLWARDLGTRHDMYGHMRCFAWELTGHILAEIYACKLSAEIWCALLLMDLSLWQWLFCAYSHCASKLWRIFPNSFMRVILQSRLRLHCTQGLRAVFSAGGSMFGQWFRTRHSRIVCHCFGSAWDDMFIWFLYHLTAVMLPNFVWVRRGFRTCLLAAGCSCIERFGSDLLSGGRVCIVSSTSSLHTVLASFVYAIGCAVGTYAYVCMFMADLSQFYATVW